MSLIDTRGHQLFPVLDAAQIATAKRFASGAAQKFAPGETVYDVGTRNTPTWLVLKGTIDIGRRDGLNHEAPIATLGIGQFTGEVGQLSGRATLAFGRAGPDGLTAVPFDAAHVRALVVGSADVGETLMRAFILRRVGLIQDGGAGSVLIGRPGAPELVRLQGFLSRNGYPNTVLDAANDEEGRAVVERLGVQPEDLPLMLCPNGTVLKRPSDIEAGVCLGITPELDPQTLYDVAVVGAGPAGLATAVYAASEGLSVLVLDQRAFGGQAGASARIENYLGFPTGISGQELASRAYVQAQKFGAEIMIAKTATQLTCGGQRYAVRIDDGPSVPARTVIIATGAEYRQPTLANLAQFEGAGVYHGATFVESQLCSREEVIVVGGGNAAGQAAVFLARTASRVHMLIRSEGLAATMSRYLIRRIEESPAIVLHAHVDLVALEGDAHLERVQWRNNITGVVEARDIRHVFFMIGAVPNTRWLEGCVVLDSKGFVKTGTDLSQADLVAAHWPLTRAPFVLETSLPGVFAVGDVRSSSMKRVASAVGEGASAVALVHQVLQQ